MQDFATMLIDTSAKIAKQMILNSKNEVYIGTVSSAKEDGSGAAVKLTDGLTVSGELLLQTMFTIEQVIEVPTSDSPRHNHTLSQALTNVTAVTSTGVPVMFVPVGVNIEDISDVSTLEKLSIQHDHDVSMELPKIRLWRGVKSGDKVLVIKLNSTSFLMLCRIGDITNEGGTKDVTD